MNDKELREKALDLNSFIIEAPAGSGKTSLLVDRYLKLLTVVDMPEEIVAITFTKKAASEMKARILKRIEKTDDSFVKIILNRSKEKGWDVEHNSSRLKIMTIDKFCHQIINQMPMLNKFSDKPNITDTPEKFYEESVKQILQAKEHLKDIKVIFEHYDNEYEKIYRSLVAMMSFRDQWKSICHSICQKSLAQIINEVDTYLDRFIEPIYQKLKATLSQSHLNDLIAVLQYLEDVAPEKSISLKGKSHFSFDKEEVVLWQKISQILFTEANTRRQGYTAAQGFRNDAEGTIYKDKCKNIPNVDFLVAIKDIPLSIDETYAVKLKAIANILLHCEKQLSQLFKKTNTLDFIEMLEIANEALGNHQLTSDLLLSLDYKISHLLIDEFQDTSRSHFNFLKKIVDGWTPKSQKTIFCVGDPMQSIYKFREADVSIFIETKEFGFNTIPLEIIKLQDNWRSSPLIVDAINQIFKKILPKEDSIHEGAISYKPFISATQNDALKESEFKFHALLFEEDLEDIDIQEAKYVCELIDTLPKTENIAILTRSRGHLSSLINYMRRFKPNLSFNAVEINTLDQHQSIQDILSLSYAILDLNDRIHWLAVLRAPWCGMTLNDLAILFEDDHTSTVWEIIQDKNKINEISLDGKNRIQRLVNILDEGFKYKSKIHIRRLVESLWIELGGESCLYHASDMIDIDKFFDILQAASSAIAIDFDLVEYHISKTYLSHHSSPDAHIQFFTVHKAKGLEFETVIIPSLNSATRASEKKMLVSDQYKKNYQVIDVAAFSEPYNESTHLYQLIDRVEKTKEKNELKRLLYVALTRAKKNLHLIASMKSKKTLTPESNSFLSLVWDIFENEFKDKTPVRSSQDHLSHTKFEDFVPKLTRIKL